jgi:hypothetical protein
MLTLSILKATKSTSASTASWTQVVRGKNKTRVSKDQQPQAIQQPQASQQSQASLKPKKKTPLEDRRILFTRDNKENQANTQDIILALNKALYSLGITVQKGQYSKTGQLSLELAEYNSSREFLAKKDYVINIVRQYDSHITGVQAGETWSKIKVYGVDLNRYFQPNGLLIAQEEIELQNRIYLPTSPRWLASESRI